MAQVTLVPWQSIEVVEFNGPWAFNGPPDAAMRAVSDGNHAVFGAVAYADSNPLRGYQWRVDGTGAVFNWNYKIITNVLVQVNINNGGPRAACSWAFVTANEPLTYAAEIFNGEVPLTVGVPTWVTMLNANHEAIKAALLADNFLTSIVAYDHLGGGQTIVVEAERVVVDYTDNTPIVASGMIAMEA